MDSKFNSKNFVNIPDPEKKISPVLKIFNKNKKHVFSIDPYITTFRQKDRFIYIIIQNNLYYEKTLDFSSKKEADEARSKLFQVKEMCLKSKRRDYYSKEDVNEKLKRLKEESVSESLSAATNYIDQDYIDQEIDKKLSGSSSFTGKALISIGGINSGDVFSGATIQQMWESLLRPYQYPSINLNSDLPNTVEVGSLLNTKYTFSWNVSNEQNVSGLTNFSGPDISINDLPVEGNTGYTLNIQRNSSASENWQITATNTKGGSFSDSENVYWRYKVFYGTNSNTSISDSEIISLNSEFSNNRYKIWYQDGHSEYIYYCYPSSFGDVSSGAPFEVNNLPNTAWTKEIRNITLSTGLSVEYIIYRTDSIQNGDGIKIEKL